MLLTEIYVILSKHPSYRPHFPARKSTYSSGSRRFSITISCASRIIIHPKSYGESLTSSGLISTSPLTSAISPEKGLNDSVDYAFLGAWNFRKEIELKEKNFIKRGGKFITHVPSARII